MKINLKRPEKDSYFMSIAKQVAQRSTCLRKRFGAVLVKDNTIVSTGYVGAPRGMPNCIDLKKCLRQELNVPGRSTYELCRSVHAELNAIINAARFGVSILDSIMYIHGENIDGNIIIGKPCKFCRRAIVNSGIKEIVLPAEKGFKKYVVKYWIKEAKKDPVKDLHEPSFL